MMPALHIRMSRRWDWARKASAAVLTEEREERSHWMNLMGVLELGDEALMAVMASSHFVGFRPLR